MLAGEEVLDNIIETYVSREIERIMQNENSQYNSSRKNYFYSSEFEGTCLSPEKKGLIPKAIEWIKQRQKNKGMDNKNFNRNDKIKTEEIER